MNSKLSQMFSGLLSSLTTDNSPERQQNKAKFIEQRVLRLSNQNLEPEILNSKISGFLDYSPQGVMNALAFNRGSLNPEIKSQIIDIIQQNPIQHNLSLDNISYQNHQHNGVSAFYSESLTPKIAIISTGNDYENAKVITYSDKIELNKLITDEAIQDCFKQFKHGDMDQEMLVKNLISLSPDKDMAFARIITGVNNQIEPVRDALLQEFDFKMQLDKMLRSDNKVGELAKTVIAELSNSGELIDYQKSRLDNYSELQDSAKQKLMLAIEDYHTQQANAQPVKNNSKQTIEQSQQPIVDNSKSENNDNEIKPTQKIVISELAKDHETLFKKVNVGDTHYWENTEKSVKIHPEKVTVPKLSRDSVELALSAAVMNFGNEIKIQGTEQFKEHILEILSTNEKYKDVTLANPVLQQKLDEMRGTVINSIEPSQEPVNMITPSNQSLNNNLLNDNKNDVKVEQNTNQNTNVDTSTQSLKPESTTQPSVATKIDEKNQVEHNPNIDQPLKIVDESKNIVLPISNNNDVVHFFKVNYPEQNQVLDKLTTNGYIEVSGVNGGIAQLSENNPAHLVHVISKAINSETKCETNQEQNISNSSKQELDPNNIDLSKIIDNILDGDEKTQDVGHSQKM